MVITNNSYGNDISDCNTFGLYDLYSKILDDQALNLVNLQTVFAAGNSEAKKDFEKVVQIDPSFTSAHENLKSMKYIGIKQVIGKINGLFKPETKND